MKYIMINNEVYRPLPGGKITRLIRSMEDQLGGKLVTKFTSLRSKTYGYLSDDNDKTKVAEDPKRVSKYKKLDLKILNFVLK